MSWVMAMQEQHGNDKLKAENEMLRRALFYLYVKQCAGNYPLRGYMVAYASFPEVASFINSTIYPFGGLVEDLIPEGFPIAIYQLTQQEVAIIGWNEAGELLGFVLSDEFADDEALAWFEQSTPVGKIMVRPPEEFKWTKEAT